MGQTETTLKSSTIARSPEDLFAEYVRNTARTLKPGDKVSLPIPGATKDLKTLKEHADIEKDKAPMGVEITFTEKSVELARSTNYIDMRKDENAYVIQVCRGDVVINIRVDPATASPKPQWINFLKTVDGLLPKKETPSTEEGEDLGDQKEEGGSTDTQEELKTEDEEPVKEELKTEDEGPVKEELKTEDEGPVKEELKTEEKFVKEEPKTEDERPAKEELKKITDAPVNFLLLAASGPKTTLSYEKGQFTISYATSNKSQFSAVLASTPSFVGKLREIADVIEDKTEKKYWLFGK